MKRDYVSAFQQTEALAGKYGLDTAKSTGALAELQDFKVTAPLVGGFSTGKSSLINALIGKKLLPVNIAPETAVPTELTAGEDSVTLVRKDGGRERLSLEQFASSRLQADVYSLVEIRTSDPFFRQIPSVKLVDMPGFDSGIEVHNRAIDEYMPRSLAYILAVAADEGSLRESIILFLNELKLYKVPVYVVITKSGKVLPEELENIRSHLQDTVRRFMGVENVTVVVTNARGSAVDVDGFRNILLDLQSKSDAISEKYFGERLHAVCAELEHYLTDRLQKSDFDGEALALEREKLAHDLTELQRKQERRNEELSRQIGTCISAVRDKIRSDLNASSSTLANMLLQGSGVQEKVNSIVRSAVLITIQTKLEPQLQRYLRDVDRDIRDFVVDQGRIELDRTTLQDDEQINAVLRNVLTSPTTTNAASSAISSLCGVVAGSSLATALGLSTAVLGPIGAAVGALVGPLLSVFLGRAKREKQEAERRQIAQDRVRELIAGVTENAGAQAEAVIGARVAEITESAGKELQARCELKQKAIAGTEKKISANAQEKAEEKARLTADLELVRRVANGN